MKIFFLSKNNLHSYIEDYYACHNSIHYICYLLFLSLFHIYYFLFKIVFVIWDGLNFYSNCFFCYTFYSYINLLFFSLNLLVSASFQRHPLISAYYLKNHQYYFTFSFYSPSLSTFIVLLCHI